MNGRGAACHRQSVRWLRRLFSESPPPMPLLLRVADPRGQHLSEVEVQTTWVPSGVSFVRRHRTASGLCVIPWLGEEDGVLVEVRAGAAARSLRVVRDREDSERAFEV